MVAQTVLLLIANLATFLRGGADVPWRTGTKAAGLSYLWIVSPKTVQAESGLSRP